MFNRPKPSFGLDIGDKVRLKLVKGVFEKGCTPRFSQEVLSVVRRFGRRPPVYELVGEEGDEIIGKWLEVCHKSHGQGQA